MNASRRWLGLGVAALFLSGCMQSFTTRDSRQLVESTRSLDSYIDRLAQNDWVDELPSGVEGLRLFRFNNINQNSAFNIEAGAKKKCRDPRLLSSWYDLYRMDVATLAKEAGITRQQAQYIYQYPWTETNEEVVGFDRELNDTVAEIAQKHKEGAQIERHNKRYSAIIRCQGFRGMNSPYWANRFYRGWKRFYDSNNKDAYLAYLQPKYFEPKVKVKVDQFVRDVKKLDVAAETRAKQEAFQARRKAFDDQLRRKQKKKQEQARALLSNGPGTKICRNGTARYKSCINPNYSASCRDYFKEGQLQGFIERTVPGGDRFQVRIAKWAIPTAQLDFVHSLPVIDGIPAQAGSLTWDKPENWFLCRW